MVLGIVTHNNAATAGLGWAGVATNTKSAGGNLNFRPGRHLLPGVMWRIGGDTSGHIGKHWLCIELGYNCLHSITETEQNTPLLKVLMTPNMTKSFKHIYSIQVSISYTT